VPDVSRKYGGPIFKGQNVCEEFLDISAQGKLYVARVHSSSLGPSFQRWHDKLLIWQLSGLYNNIKIK
jgi:hypothetical protein